MEYGKRPIHTCDYAIAKRTYAGWNLTLSQLSIHFPGKLDDQIDR